MAARRFAPGFRLSAFDVGVLIAGVLTTAGLATIHGTLALFAALVVGHFFLFCNVIRMARALELCWAGWFILAAGSTLSTGTPNRLVTTVLVLAATMAVVAVELRKPSYHGVGWQRINPRLREWWDEHQM